eukprot:5694883-Amphidinium_carterae.1
MRHRGFYHSEPPPEKRLGCVLLSLMFTLHFNRRSLPYITSFIQLLPPQMGDHSNKPCQIYPAASRLHRPRRSPMTSKGQECSFVRMQRKFSRGN